VGKVYGVPMSTRDQSPLRDASRAFGTTSVVSVWDRSRVRRVEKYATKEVDAPIRGELDVGTRPTGPSCFFAKQASV